MIRDDRLDNADPFPATVVYALRTPIVKPLANWLRFRLQALPFPRAGSSSL
jgi:hypothetical protein